MNESFKCYMNPMRVHLHSNQHDDDDDHQFISSSSIISIVILTSEKGQVKRNVP